VRAVELWKKEITLSNPITHEIVSDKVAYETIIEDFAECYLKDAGMTDKALNRFREDYQ